MMTDNTTRQAPPRKLPRRHRQLVMDACGIAAISTYVAGLAHVPVWPAVAVLVLGGAIAAAVVQGVSDAGWLAGSVLAWGCALAGWLAFARLTRSEWTLGTGVVLGLAGAGLTAWSLLAYAGMRVTHHRIAAADHDREESASLRKIETVLAGLGCEGVRARSEEQTREGRLVTLVMPQTGKVTIRNLIGAAEGAAAALRLADGAVWFEKGKHAAVVLMHVDEHDVMTEDLPLPPVRVSTVNEPIAVGRSGADSEHGVSMREPATLVVGVTDSGKSNILNVITAGLVSCTDAVTWAIDLKGGRFAAPWLQPWVDGKCRVPALDWVATTREEAWIMLQAVDRLITARAESGSGGSKIVPTPEQPGVILLGDEIADVVGERPKADQAGGASNRDMSAKVVKLVSKVRSEAVSLLLTVQRGTVSYTGSGDLKAQCGQRIALGAASETDARYAVADDAAAARLIARLSQRGTGIVWRRGGGRAVAIKFYRLDPSLDEPHGAGDLARIHEIATRAGSVRPELDALALEALGEVYVQRWNRSPLYQRLAAGSPAAEELAAVTLAAVPPEPTAAQMADQARELFARAGFDTSGEQDPRKRTYALLADRPHLGMSVMEIRAALLAEGIERERETISRMLSKEVAAGLVVRKGEGTSVRYYLARPES